MFLTDREKADHLTRWSELRGCTSNPTAPGNPDPAIFLLTNALNALDGVCTVQSCAGHRRGQAIDAAHIWLRTSAPVFNAMLRSAPQLVEHDEIEELAVRYGRTASGPIIEIIFAGSERGCLEQSSAILLDYVTRATGTVT